ncbi:hypothetical protein V490_00445, partial [Pseudogymnoascus sp. VKM F-3557]
FAQPSIAYYLRATVRLNTSSGAGSKTVDTSLPVIITPYTQEYPPTEITDFPTEFNEQETKVLRRYLMGRGLGAMTASTREPPPLTYDIQSTHACTEASVKLELESESSSEIYHILQNLTFKICPLIRIKTFYSLQPFPKLPSQGLLSLRGVMRLRDEMIKLDRKDVRGVSWKYIFQQSNQAPETQPTIATLPVGKWTAHLPVPITADTRLLPTFCTSVVARLYAIIIQVKVSGVRMDSFNLEVPVQVIHKFPEQRHATQTEPMRDEQMFLAFRRASESSWISEEAMESAGQPPHYYP